MVQVLSWPFWERIDLNNATVWPSGSGAYYEVDWVNDEIEIQQALDDNGAIKLLKWNYNMWWDIILDSFQSICWQWFWISVISWWKIVSNWRIHNSFISELSADGIELDSYYTKISNVWSVTSNDYWIKFDVSNPSVGNNIYWGRYSWAISWIHYSDLAQDFFIQDFECFWWVRSLDIEWSWYNIDWAFLWDGSAWWFRTTKAGIVWTIRAWDTPIITRIEAKTNNVFWTQNWMTIDKIIQSWSLPIHIVEIEVDSWNTAKVQILNISWTASSEEVSFIWPWKIISEIRSSTEVIGSLVSWSPVMRNSDNSFMQPYKVTNTAPSPSMWMIYMDWWANTWSWDSWFRRRDGSVWKDM